VSRIPHARTVTKALRSVRSVTQNVLRATNRLAGQRTAKGDYVAAEFLVSKAKEIRQFQTEVEAVIDKWRGVSASDRNARNKQTTTPLWQYYQPVLSSLAKLGGEGKRPELEAHVHRIMASSLRPGDNAATTSGSERWRKMVQRTRKHLIAEGWIENRPGPIWKITDAGRLAAEKTISPDSTK
jgi:Mrr N-terminal domain